MVRQITFTESQRETIEASVRKARRRTWKKPDIKERVRLTYDLAARPDAPVDAQGKPIPPKDGAGNNVRVDVKGRAFLVRFKVYAPEFMGNERANYVAKNRTRDGERDAMRYARKCGVDVLPVSDDTFDGWYLAVGSPHDLGHWLDMKEQHIDSVADLQTYRVAVIGGGQAGGAALQRRAYKDTLREMRQAKIVKTVSGFARHTADEGDLALLCRCVHCGADVRAHDDSICTAPTFVADANAIVEQGITPTDNRPTDGERRNRRETTDKVIAKQELDARPRPERKQRIADGEQETPQQRRARTRAVGRVNDAAHVHLAKQSPPITEEPKPGETIRPTFVGPTE